MCVYIYIHININDVGDIAVAATHSIWSMKVHGNWAQTRIVTELHRFIGDLPRKSCRNPSRKMWVADTEMASFSADLSAVIRQKWIHTHFPYSSFMYMYAIKIGSRMILIEVSGTPWPASQTFERAKFLLLCQACCMLSDTLRSIGFSLYMSGRDHGRPRVAFGKILPCRSWFLNSRNGLCRDRSNMFES
jgi:hypothetical protein